MIPCTRCGYYNTCVNCTLVPGIYLAIRNEEKVAVQVSKNGIRAVGCKDFVDIKDLEILKFLWKE